MDELIIRGLIDANDQLIIYGMDDLQAFQKKLNRKAKGQGARILIKIQELPKDTKQRMIAYIKSKIIPDFQRAMKENGERFTFSQVEERILSFSVTANYGIRSIEDMNHFELREFIDEMKQFAAENYSFYIDDSCMI